MTEHSSSKDVSGWLSKWSNTSGRYEKLWFSLSKAMLACNTIQKDGLANTGECEVISLFGANIDFDDTRKFIIFQEGEAWHVKADSQQETKRWIEALTAARNAAAELVPDNEPESEGAMNFGSQSEIIDQDKPSNPISTEQNEKNKDVDFLCEVDASSQMGEDTATFGGNSTFDKNQASLYSIDADSGIPSKDATDKSNTVDLSQLSHLMEVNDDGHDEDDLAAETAVTESILDECSRLNDPENTGKEVHDENHTYPQQGVLIMSTIEKKLRDIQTYNDRINICNWALQKSITAMGNSLDNEVLQELSKQAEEYQQNASAMTNACADYLNLAEVNNRQWITLYQCEHEQRVKFEQIVKLLTKAESRSNDTNSEDEESSEYLDCPEFNTISELGETNVTVQVYPAVGGPGEKQMRRTRISDRPNVSDSLWTILKNCIGTDLSKMPLPVSFAEPLSLLQRLTEDFEYAHVLDEASTCTDTATQVAYIAAFISSSYSTTIARTGKPFNPLLGETYECDRQSDLGWRSIAEQVSHHPPVAAIHGEGKNWTLWMDQSLKTKFKGTTLTITPIGECHLNFKNGNRYSWRKPNTSIHNVIVGKLWVEQEGDVDIKCATGDITGKLTFVGSGWTGESFTLKGVIKDGQKSVFDIIGRYSTHVEYRRAGSKDKGTVIWKRTEPPADNSKYYNFTLLACQLNEMENGIAPTDSRLRPDQRLMEDGNFDAANVMKKKLEEHQRANKKESWMPSWFQRKPDPDTKTEVWTYGGEYWPCKAKKDWSRCPTYIFSPPEAPQSNDTS